MITYPITYGNILEENNSITDSFLKYWSDETNQLNFYKGYKFGLIFFSLVLVSKVAFVLISDDSSIYEVGKLSLCNIIVKNESSYCLGVVFATLTIVWAAAFVCLPPKEH